MQNLVLINLSLWKCPQIPNFPHFYLPCPSFIYLIEVRSLNGIPSICYYSKKNGSQRYNAENYHLVSFGSSRLNELTMIVLSAFDFPKDLYLVLKYLFQCSWAQAECNKFETLAKLCFKLATNKIILMSSSKETSSPYKGAASSSK